MNEVYEAIKSGCRSHYEIAIKTKLPLKEIAIATSKLEQGKYVFQLTQGNFAITSRKYDTKSTSC